MLNAKTSGKGTFFEAFGVVARKNDLENVKFIVTAEGPANRPAKGIPDWWGWTKYDIGRFEIQNNRDRFEPIAA
tara:strand:+ start:18436 stop:18657 length:222 start_codon:yes stop_codon:yes gene_type:complete